MSFDAYIVLWFVIIFFIYIYIKKIKNTGKKEGKRTVASPKRIVDPTPTPPPKKKKKRKISFEEILEKFQPTIEVPKPPVDKQGVERVYVPFTKNKNIVRLTDTQNAEDPHSILTDADIAKIEHLDHYKIKKNDNNHPILDKFADPNSMRDAFIMSEIFKRKF